jgi:protein-S-isoprenylcysteine O-methyltransferase Ste14
MTEAAVFQVLLDAIFGVAAIVALALCFVTAPYGRHGRPGWGPTMGATAGWIVMEAPAALALPALFVIGERHDAAAVALLGLWELHYLHRAFVFPARRHVAGRVMPVAVVAMAIVFNAWNGYLNGRWLFHFAPARGSAWLADPRFLVGAALFLTGLVVNLHSDEILRRLRRSGYAVPQGGLFRFVTSPNYLGELVEWCGWALASWSVAGLAFAVFTAANLVPRAWSHHAWCRRTFPDYPPERRAVIPGLL